MAALFIVWNSSFDIGIDILDEQHRGLTSLINTFFFHRADATADIEKFLTPSAEMFEAYARLNFLTLEKLMRESNFPDVENVVVVHEEMLTTIHSAGQKYKAARDASGFLQFLKTYWLEYACKPDTDFIQHIKNYYGDQI